MTAPSAAFVTAVIARDRDAASAVLADVYRQGTDAEYLFHEELAWAVMRLAGGDSATQYRADVEVRHQGADGSSEVVEPDAVTDRRGQCVVRAARFVAAVTARDTEASRAMFALYMEDLTWPQLTIGLCDLIEIAAQQAVAVAEARL